MVVVDLDSTDHDLLPLITLFVQRIPKHHQPVGPTSPHRVGRACPRLLSPDPSTNSNHTERNTTMSTTDYTDDDFYTQHDMLIDDHRVKLITQLNTALAALHQASTTINELCSDQVYDVEFAETPAGGDVAAFIADSLRYTRAAYTIAHDITEHR